MAIEDLIKKSKINLYCCGPTVYDLLHIGNARPVIVTDFLVRFMEYKNIKVDYLLNITDIDDKIIQKALNEGVEEYSVAQRNKEYFLNNLNDLKIRKPNSIISISEKIENIKKFIEILLNKNSAYEINGNVYFDLSKYTNKYGLISGQKIKENLNSVRIENSIDKKNSYDFSLWKKTKVGIQFESNFGPGRPGWHTECALLIDEYFDSETIDIHLGGVDLKFPHHENEAIQFFAKNNKEISFKWLHVGHITLDDQKMSKSIGNIITINEFIENNSANSLRFIFANSSQTQPININEKLIINSNNWTNKVFNLMKKINWMKALNLLELSFIETSMEDKFSEYMIDELNTPRVISLLDEIIKELNNSLNNNSLNNILFSQFKTILDVLGFNFVVKSLNNKDIENLKLWNNLVIKKEFEKADFLRKKLNEGGIL